MPQLVQFPILLYVLLDIPGGVGLGVPLDVDPLGTDQELLRVPGYIRPSHWTPH